MDLASWCLLVLQILVPCRAPSRALEARAGPDGGCLAQEPGGEAGGGAAGRRARARGARQEGREAEQVARSAREAKRNVRGQAPHCARSAPVGRSGAAGGQVAAIPRPCGPHSACH